jgi:hypothetical protein
MAETTARRGAHRAEWRRLGASLANFSIYPAPSQAGEVRFRIPEGIELEPAIEKVRVIMEAHPRVLAAPSVLLDHTEDDNRIEIVVVFHTADNEIAALKSDLMKAVHTAFDAMSEKRPLAEQRRRGTRDDGSVSAPRLS